MVIGAPVALHNSLGIPAGIEIAFACVFVEKCASLGPGGPEGGILSVTQMV